MGRKRINGEGNYYKTKKGLVKFTITAGYDENGKAIVKCFYGKTHAQAKEKYEEWRKKREDINCNVSVSPDISFADWLNMWLDTYKKGHVQESTYKQLCGYKNKIPPALARKKVIDITPIELQKMISAAGENKSKNYTDKFVQILRSCFEYAIDNGLIARSPAKNLTSKPEIKKPRQVYSADELKKIFECALTWRQNSAHEIERNSARVVGYGIITLAVTGLRRGELLGLKWADIAANKIVVNRAVYLENNVPAVKEYKAKTNKALREVPIERWVFDLLETLPHKSEFIFCTSNGTLMHPRNFNRSFDAFIEENKIRDLTPHCLRHTYATLVLDGGADLVVLSQMLGHADVKTTAIYAHPDFVQKQKAAASIFSALKNAEKI